MSKPNNLDQSIAAAIKGELKTAAALSDLIEEVTAAASVAVQDAAAENARALDPTVIDDTAADAARAAELRAQRLNAALPPLRDLLAKRLETEYAERWNADFHRVEKLFDAAAAKLSRYGELASELIAIFTEVQRVEQECGRVNGAAPSGESRRLRFRTNVTKLIATTTLPAWDGSHPLWPQRHGSIATAMFAPPAYNPAYSGDWWQAGEEQRIAEEANQKQQAENAEIAKREFYQGR